MGIVRSFSDWQHSLLSFEKGSTLDLFSEGGIEVAGRHFRFQPILFIFFVYRFFFSQFDIAGPCHGCKPVKLYSSARSWEENPWLSHLFLLPPWLPSRMKEPLHRWGVGHAIGAKWGACLWNSVCVCVWGGSSPALGNGLTKGTLCQFIHSGFI